MTLPREAWPRLKEAFEGARALALDARPAYLPAVCNGDDALRREVELLLAHNDQAASFLETPAMPVDDSLVAKSLEGQCIGPYQISALIGRGGMGEVYRARDTKLNRIVALKVLPERFALDPDRAARFTREAHLLATLNHPNIGAIYGLEESNRTQALVLELVDGPTLSDRIARGPMSLAEALTIARQMAEALEAAHEKGIIHRDLKPANIKIAGNGVVKVLDFGPCPSRRGSGGRSGRKTGRSAAGLSSVPRRRPAEPQSRSCPAADDCSPRPKTKPPSSRSATVS